MLALLSLCLYGIDKTANVSQYLQARLDKPPRVIVVGCKLVNKKDKSETFLKRGDFVLWLPEGIGGVRSMSGKYELIDENGRNRSEFITIDASATKNVYAELQNGPQVARILDSGETDLELIFRRKTGGINFSGAIPFTRKRIKTTRWRLDLKEEE